MGNYILVLLLFSSCANKFSFLKTYSKENLEDFHFSNDSTFQKLQNENDVTIASGNINPAWGLGSDRYYILPYRSRVWYSIYYRKLSEPVMEHSYFLATISISQSIQDSIFNVFKATDFWKITPKMNRCLKDSEESKDSFYCVIHDASTQQVVTFYKHKILNIKEYYALQYFQECCPANSDREAVIKSYQAILVLKKHFDPISPMPKH